MRSSLLIIIISTFMAVARVPLAFAGGDLGGGGLLGAKRDFQLNAQKLQVLRQQGALSQAKEAWLENMTPQEEADLLNKVFKHLIAPQLLQQQGAQSGDAR